jgi:hypothetical protein
MSESTNNKLKDFSNQVYSALLKIDQSSAGSFLKEAGDTHLYDILKYYKWYIEVSDKDRDTSAFKSADFLESKEFNDWTIGKKIAALISINYMELPKTKDKPGESFSLKDYEALIEKNKTAWSPELKYYSIKLIPGQSALNLSIDDLDKIDFANWLARDQVEFLKIYFETPTFLANLTLENLFKHKIFKDISDEARYELINGLIKRGQKLKDDVDINKLNILPLRKFGLSYDLKLKSDNKLLNFMNEHKNKRESAGKDALSSKEIKELNGFGGLCPEEQLFALLYSGDLKFDVIESIKDVEKITNETSLYANIDVFAEAFRKIADDKGGGLTLASLAKSKLPTFAKIKALEYLNIVQPNDKVYALRIVAYPDGISLLFQNIYENLFSDKENKEELIEKDLNLIEVLTEDYLYALGQYGKKLGLNDEDIKKFGDLAKTIHEEKEKYKGKSLSERISFWAKVWRVIVNIFVIPFLWTKASKKARQWFTKVSEQIKSYEFEEKLNKIADKIGFQNKIIPSGKETKENPKTEKTKEEKKGKKNEEKQKN